MNKIRFLYFAFAILLSILFFGCDDSSRVEGEPHLALRGIRNISVVPTNANLYLEFSENIDFQTVNADTFYLLDGSRRIDGTLKIESNRVTFLPTHYLDALHSYTLVVTKELLSEEGFGLLEEYHWNFNSLAHADSEKPKLIALLPDNNASIYTEIALEFDEQIVIEDSKSSIIELTDPSHSIIDGSSTLEFNRIRFSPTSALALDTKYHIQLKQKLNDLSGNPYSGKDEWDFNTTKDEEVELLSQKQIASFETQVSILSMRLVDDILILGTQDSILTYQVDPLTCKLKFVSSLSTKTPVYTTVISKNTLYVGTSNAILILSIDATGIVGKSLHTRFKTTSAVFDLAIKQNTLFVAQTSSGAQAFDISEASNLVKSFDFTDVWNATELALSDNSIYISGNDISVFTLEGNFIKKIATVGNIYDLQYDTNTQKLSIADGINGFSSEVKNSLLHSRSFINKILAIKEQRNFKLLSDYNRGAILYDDSGFNQTFLSFKKGLFALTHNGICTLLGYESGTIKAVDILAPYVKHSSSVNRDITLVFNENILENSLTKENFTFTDENSNPIAFTLAFDTNKTLTIQAQEDLHVKHHYSLHVKDIIDLYQNSMLEDFILNFDANHTENIAPHAYNDKITMQEDTVVQISILNNDIDVNGDDTIDKSSVRIVHLPSHGTAFINNSGTVSYRPYPNYYGKDTFEYKVSDKEGATSNTASVNISINDVYDPPPNQAPVANDDSAIYISTPIDIYVLNNDTDVDSNIDPTSIIITKESDIGASISINSSTGTITYSLYTTLTSSDTFRYKVKDTLGAVSNEATVTVNPY